MTPPAREQAPAKIYSVAQIAIGAVLGAPIGGAALIASNAKRFGKTGVRLQALLWGAISTIVLLGVALKLPDQFPHQVIPAIYVVIIVVIANRLQQSAITEFLEAGGVIHSYWRVIFIGIAWFAIIAVTFSAYVFIFSPN